MHSIYLGAGRHTTVYLGAGRQGAAGGVGGLRQHVWVVTREGNGDVLMWETTKGSYYK
jgi:hypothetical protein